METATEVCVQVYIRNEGVGINQIEFRETFQLRTGSFQELAEFFSKLHEFFVPLKKKP